MAGNIFYPVAVSGEWLHREALIENEPKDPTSSNPGRFSQSIPDGAIKCHFKLPDLGEPLGHFASHIVGYYRGDPPRIEIRLISNGDTVKNGETTMAQDALQTLRSPWIHTDPISPDAEVTLYIKNHEPKSTVFICQVALCAIPSENECPVVPVIENSPITNFRAGIRSNGPLDVDYGFVTVEWDADPAIEVEIHRRLGNGVLQVGQTDAGLLRDPILIAGVYEYSLVIPGQGVHPETVTIDVDKVRKRS